MSANVEQPDDEAAAKGSNPSVGTGKSDGASYWLDDHLRILRRRINSEALALAKLDGRDEVEPRDIAQAAILFAPGKEVIKNEEEMSFSKRMSLSITGVTLMSCLLAAIFGIIGAYQTRAGNAQIASGAFDIAKIFAGAIVGSTGASVATTIKRT
jgi:hypothetical protein